MDHQPVRLTPEMSSRRLAVLAFIKRFFAEHGEGPSRREIAAASAISPQRASRIVKALAGDGLIWVTPGVARSIVPLDDTAAALRLLREQGWKIDGDMMRLAQPGVPERPLLGADPADYVPAHGKRGKAKHRRRTHTGRDEPSRLGPAASGASG